MLEGFSVTIFINFDEVPVFFEMQYNYSLDISGNGVVGLRSYGKDKERVSVVLCITSDGKAFPPILIFNTQSEKYNNNEGILETFHPYLKDMVKKVGCMVLSNHKGWKYTFLMKTYIVKFYKNLVEQFYGNEMKRIIFLFDNFKAHTDIEVLKEYQRYSNFYFFNIWR